MISDQICTEKTDQKTSGNNRSKFIQSGLSVIETELDAIQLLKSKIDEKFIKCCDYLLNCQGRIVVAGMGKSGHIARKIAATLASTGSPAFFLHPAEATHGDFGMITQKDVVLAISNSGETAEILTILPMIKRLGIPFITLTGKSDSSLARQANVNLDIHITKEACPLNLAPTASTTAALVMGDAIAIALLEARGFTQKDFAFSHPGGRLGRRLLLQVQDIMHIGDEIPKVTEDTLLSHALLEITKKSLGMTGIVDKQNCVVGIFTDGDLRRTLDRNINVHKTMIGEVMTRNCTTVKSTLLAAESLQLMESRKINSFLVTDDKNHLIGAFNFIDLLRAGVT